jgi:chromate reductase, NAD(P)H dehydrogenase (quinone)
MKFLAISGSLRRVSSNTALLRATAALAPEGIEVVFYDGLGGLPHFNPDLEENEPSAVTAFRELVREADGLVISSPEYAHGVPGVLKNALDWLVGGSEFVGKPVVLFNATPPAAYAQASLAETVTIMSGRLVPEAYVEVNLRGKNLDESAIVAHPEISASVRAGLTAFAGAIGWRQ